MDSPPSTLLARLRTGDRDALRELYRAHYESLFRLAVILTRSGDSAKDIVHDVFLNIWDRRAVLDIHTDVRIYLMSAVRNRAFQQQRHERVIQATHHAVDAATLPVPAIGTAPRIPEDETQSREFLDAYHKTLAVLTERDRAVLRLRLEEECTFEQIAQILGLSAMGARGVFLKAQKKMQRVLAGHWR